MRVLIFDDDELRHSEYDRIRPTDGKDVAFKIVPLEDEVTEVRHHIECEPVGHLQ